jgi:oligogalacturonide lyase
MSNSQTPIRISPRTLSRQLLYFTSTSLLEDDQHLIAIGDHAGHPNLFRQNLGTGEEQQLTSNSEGVLKAYVYFDGQPYRGFAKGSVSLDAPRGLIYYIQGMQICSVDIHGKHRTLAELPPGQMTAFTHVSADGSRLCVPTVDARALDGDTLLPGKPAYDIDQRVREENLCAHLRVYDTCTGKLLFAEPVPRAWITHVQFSPLNNDHILYNHEWPADCGIRRMWLWDGHQHLRLRTPGEGRSPADWTCHEMWERDAQAIIYHGRYHKGAYYIGRVRPDGSDLVEIPLDAAFTRYGHFTVGQPGQLVTDGYYQEDSLARPGPGEWISLLHVDWQRRQLDWQPLCKHRSSWRSQDAHPHPIFNHQANAIYFTCDADGTLAIYRLACA